MTEVEKRENEALKKCLKEAYGYSDEQLRKEMEEAEQSLNDSDFPGAEERIYQKIMEREAAEKKAANTGADENAPDGKKAVRLGKKRVFLVSYPHPPPQYACDCEVQDDPHLRPNYSSKCRFHS